MKQEITGYPVEFPNFGTGPLISKQTYEINAGSGLFNWNPPQIALVSYFDPNFESTVTKGFLIGGSYGPTEISITTGSFSPGGYAAATQIAVLQQSVLPTLPLGELFPGTIGEFLGKYGNAADVANALSSSSTYSVSLLSSDPTTFLPNVTYAPGVLEEKNVNPNAFYSAQGLDYPFVGSSSIFNSSPRYFSPENNVIFGNSNTTGTSSNPVLELLREIGSLVFGGGGNTAAAPLLG